ncbi:mCG1028722, partial [Mus musculus]
VSLELTRQLFFRDGVPLDFGIMCLIQSLFCICYPNYSLYSLILFCFVILLED